MDSVQVLVPVSAHHDHVEAAAAALGEPSFATYHLHGQLWLVFVPATVDAMSRSSALLRRIPEELLK